jgi:hypothetical protein
MIMSVSTLMIRRGAATPVRVVNFSMIGPETRGIWPFLSHIGPMTIKGLQRRRWKPSKTAGLKGF